MRFEAVGWLILLLPWLVLAVWVWRREWALAPVSSRFLWPASQVDSKRNHDHSLPPLWILAVLLALLCGVVALAAPSVARSAMQLTVVIDRHVSMSATVHGKTILQDLSEQFSRDLRDAPTPVQLRFDVPGSSRLIRGIGELKAVEMTDASTGPLIESRCRQLEREGHSYIVLSAQKLALPEGALRYAPTELPTNVAIVRASASAEPVPQMMLEITHPTNQRPFDVRIRGANSSLTHRVQPQFETQQTTVFVALPPDAGDWIAAEILGDDDFAADDAAYLVRKGGWPRIEVAGNVPSAVERFAAIYAKQRPASAMSKLLLFTTAGASDASSIQFAEPDSDIGEQFVSLDLPWRAISGVDRVSITRVSRAVPEGFEVIARAGEIPVVAIKDVEPRQVWIGFGIDRFAQTPQWVQWLDSLIEHATVDGPPRWDSVSTDAIRDGWNSIVTEPHTSNAGGVFRSRDGSLVAANLPEVKWQLESREAQTLSKVLETARRKGSIPLSGYLTGGALGLAAIGGLLTARQRRLDVTGGAT